jgi:hypothetical protein
MPVHFSILAFRWTFVHLTLRTTGTALAWKTLAGMLGQTPMYKLTYL